MGWGGGEREEEGEEGEDVWVGRGEGNGWEGAARCEGGVGTHRARYRRSQLEVRVGAGVACGEVAGGNARGRWRHVLMPNDQMSAMAASYPLDASLTSTSGAAYMSEPHLV